MSRLHYMNLLFIYWWRIIGNVIQYKMFYKKFYKFYFVINEPNIFLLFFIIGLRQFLQTQKRMYNISFKEDVIPNKIYVVKDDDEHIS